MPARPTLSALAGLGTTVLAVGLVAAPAHAAPTHIRILTVNDFHGRLVADEFAGLPGAAVLAGAVDVLSEGQPTAFVSAGDNIGASPFVSAVAEDAPTIEALNAMGLVTGAVGNHEFDRGYDFLADEATHGVSGDGLADWTSLGANVEGESPDLASSEVVDVGGVAVGFVGVVTEQTASLVSPDGIAGITFVDPVAPANAAAAELRDGDQSNGEADVVVLLAHDGAPDEAADATSCAALADGGSPFADLVAGASADIDAIVGGHTHLTVDCELPHPDGGTVPRPVIEANSYGMSLGQLDLTVDPETDVVTAAAGSVVDVAAGGYEADPEVAAIVEAAEAEADVIGQEAVGEITEDITRAFTGDGEEDRGSESVLGNFVADVQLSATEAEDLGGAQIAFMNPGGLRADLLVQPTGDEGEGVVTYAEAATVQPFANGVVTMTLTGAQVEQVLEQQWQPEGSSRPFLALGVSEGFFYTFDADAAQGERIQEVTLDGEPLDPAAEYRVTVNSFLASGGDNFTVLAEGTDRQDNGFNDLNVLVDYLRANSPITPDTEPRRAVAEDPQPAQPEPTASPGPGTDPTQQPTSAPTTPGRGGQNPGLEVDTGVTGAAGPSPAVIGGVLTLLLLAGGAAATGLARTSRGRR